MRGVIYAIVVLVAALLGGCAGVGARGRDVARVQVFVGTQPEGSWQRIEEIETTVGTLGVHLGSPLERAAALARVEAANAGGDFVILTDRREELVRRDLRYPDHIDETVYHYRWIVAKAERPPPPRPEPRVEP